MADQLQEAGLEWVNKNLAGFLQDINRANSGMESAGDSAEKAGGGFSAFGSILTGVSTAVATFAIDSVVKLGSAMAGLAQDSIGVAAEFESSMAVLSIAANDPTLALEDLREASIAVGGDTRLLGVSASGAAESLTGLYKSGLTTTEIFGDLNGYMNEGAELGGALRASIDLAAATTLDMVEASDLAAVALATFGGELETEEERAEFITDAMNSFVKAADASVAEVSDLAQGIRNVGPQASAMGFGIDEVNAALGILSTRGIAGAEAGTNLNSMLTNLQRDTPKVTSLMDELGVSLFDQDGNFLSLVDIIGQFQIAMDGMSEAERNHIALTLAGSYGQRAFNTLIGEGVEGWVGMTTAMDDASGIMEQAEAKSQTFAAQQEALEGVIETLQIEIGSALLPVLTNLATFAQDFIAEHGDKLVGIFEAIGSAAQQFFGVLLDTGDPFAAIMEVLDDFLPEETINKIWEFASAIQTGITETLPDVIAKAQDFGTKMMEVFTVVKDWVDENWPAIQEGILTAVDAIKDWFEKNWPIIQATVLTAWEVIKDVFETIRELIVDKVVPPIQDAFAAITEAMDTIGISFDDVKRALMVGAGAIVAVVMFVISAVIGIVTGLVTVAKSMAERFASFVSNIKGAFEGLIQFFVAFGKIITSVFKGDFSKANKYMKVAWQGLFKFLKKIGKAILDAVIAPFEAIIKFVSKFVTTIIDFFKGLSKKLVGKSIIPDMMEAIQEVIERVLEAIRKFIERILDNIARIWEEFKDTIVDLWDKAWALILSIVEKVGDKIKSAIDTIVSAVTKAWDDFVEAIKTAWENMWDAIEKAVGAAKTVIEGAFDALAAAVGLIWDTFTGALETAWGTLWTNVQTALDNAVMLIEGAISGFTERVQTAWDTFTAGISTAWDTLWSNLATAVSSAWDAVVQAVDDGLDAITGFFDLQATVDKILDFGGRIVDGISEGLAAGWDAVTGAVEAGLELIKTAFGTAGKLWTIVVAIAGRFVDTLKKGIETAWHNISSALEGLIDGLISSGNAVWEVIKSQGTNFVNALKDGIRNAWQGFVDWIVGLFGCPGAWPWCWGSSGDEQSYDNNEFETSTGGITDSFDSGRVVAPSRTTNVDRSRTIQLELNQNIGSDAQVDANMVYYDVVAALQAARVAI